MRFSIPVLLLFALLISNSMAFVSKPVDKIPGVQMPTPNPEVPTLAPQPTVVLDSGQVTPLYIITTPTANPSPIFQEIKEELPVSEKKHSYATLKIILFSLSTVLIVGGLLFFYKKKG